MARRNILVFIKQLKRPVFTTLELKNSSGKSLSAVTQALNYLEKQGLILKVYHGIWVEASSGRIDIYSIIPFLFPRQRAYLSFVSALHLYGIIEQIPQVITLASISHSKTMHTKLGTFSVHQINPLFFKGFDWYKKEGSFLIAEQEKALVDCLYLSAFKKNQFSFFPELHFSSSFDFKKAEKWVKFIPNPKIRLNVQEKLKSISRNKLKYA